MKKLTLRRIFLLAIFIIILLLNIYTIIFIIQRYEDEKHNQELLETIDQVIDRDDTPYNDNLEFMTIDFNELLSMNSDTVAYLKVDGTNINYPVVQTNNNDYYLTHSFDHSENDSGWIFLDYRNNISL